MLHYKNHTGFSLFEMMIALAIISILAALTYPMYSRHLITAHRLQAVNILTAAETALQTFQFEHQTYEGATLESLHISTHSISQNYRLTLQTTIDDYSLTAEPINQQVNDQLCGTVSINAAGDKTISGTGTTEECW